MTVHDWRYDRAALGGHTVRRIDVGALTFPTGDELGQTPPEAILRAQEAILWADYLVIVFPLWLSSAPARLKSFFEHVCRYGFSFDEKARGLLGGRSARMVVTMMAPGLIFRLLFSSGVRSLRRGVLWTSGFRPIRTTVLSNVTAAPREKWHKQMEALGLAPDRRRRLASYSLARGRALQIQAAPRVSVVRLTA